MSLIVLTDGTAQATFSAVPIWCGIDGHGMSYVERLGTFLKDYEESGTFVWLLGLRRVVGSVESWVSRWVASSCIFRTNVSVYYWGNI